MGTPRNSRRRQPVTGLTPGQMIGLARSLAGITLRDLEKRTRISNALLSQIETGHVKEPSFSNVVRIARALNLPLERLAECCFDATDYGLR